MPTLLKKILLSFLSFLVFFYSIAPNFSVVKAQEAAWFDQGFAEWYNKVYDGNTSPESEIFGERYTAAQVQWVMYGVFSNILNYFMDRDVVACFITNSGNIETCLDALNIISANPHTKQMLTTQTERPQQTLASLVFADRSFSGIGYVKEKLNNLSLVPEAKAQSPGFGFGALMPVRSMWRASRDIAFGLFIIAAIVLSFMIMFRVKISPQVIITVQSAIPKLIIALILVTFSYAIAGALIDLMYVVYGFLSLVGSGFFPFGKINPQSLFQFLTAGCVGCSSGLNINISPLPGVQTGPIPIPGVEIGIGGLLAFYLVLFPLILLITLFTFIGSVVGALTAAVAVVAAISPIGGTMVLLGIIIIIAALLVTIWVSIKAVWSLIKAFANILLLTIFAPIQIVAGVIMPNFGFNSWARSYISNLAVFVVTSALIYFSYIFLFLSFNISFARFFGEGRDGSPFIWAIINFFFGTGMTSAIGGFGRPSNWPPLLLGDGMIGLIYVGVSFVLFTLIPKATELIQAALSGKPFAYGTAIGEAFGLVSAAYNSGPVKEYRAQSSAEGALSLANFLVDKFGSDTQTANQNSILNRVLNRLQRNAGRGGASQ